MAGNAEAGIVSYHTYEARITRNRIGLGTSDEPLSNGTGIYTLKAGAVDIGSDLPRDANEIAFNDWGIFVDENSEWISIRVNSIHDNEFMGIDLSPEGVAPNDDDDVDTGPNGLQNSPTLSDVSPTSISGTLESVPSNNFMIDVYENLAPHPSSSSEGEVFLGSVSTTTDATGVASFTLNL